VTSSVHYLRFALTPAQAEAFGSGPVVLAVDHPSHTARPSLPAVTVAELLDDLHGPYVERPTATLGARRGEFDEKPTKGLVSGPSGFYHAGVPGSEGHAGHEAKR